VTGPSYGVALQGVDPPASFASMVAEIESLGFDPAPPPPGLRRASPRPVPDRLAPALIALPRSQR
jgi:hypothetical protein